jgi:predicted small lipoprotein YifL
LTAGRRRDAFRRRIPPIPSDRYTARMNRRFRILSVAIVAIASALALSGCGNKGPLVLAEDVPAEVPATTDPATTDLPTNDPATPPAADDPAAKPPR